MKRGRHVRGCQGRSGWSLPVAQAGCELDMHGDILPRCRPLRLIHSIFLRNFRMKPEPPEIAQVRRNLTNLRAPGGDILEGSPPTRRTNGEAHAGQSRQTENRSDR
jgi:hypothetical protein